MKNHKNMFAFGFALIVLVVMASRTLAQTGSSEIKIKTSVVCNMCKENIEKYLAFEKGVKRSEVDVQGKTVTVTYDPDKTNPDNIRKAITKSGYDADDMPANPKAYKKLDACCKKGAVCTDKKNN
jgi:periplasmic mercuric ion binding protein